MTGVTAGTYSAQLSGSLPADTPNKTQMKTYLDAMTAAGFDSAEPTKINAALGSRHYTGAMSGWTRTANDHAGADGGYLLAKFDGHEWKALSSTGS